MRVLHIASEVAPWSHSGGLGDVVGALPGALARTCQVAVVTPLYRTVRARRAPLIDTGIDLPVALGRRAYTARLHTLANAGPTALGFLDAPALYDRDGLYADDSGLDYDDNHLRFAVLCRAALAAAPHLLGGPPDIVHAHDWQAGLAPLYARDAAPGARAVFTIHNLAFRGLAPKHAMEELGLPWELFNLDQLEFYDRMSTLKAGVAFADAVTTVSPTYAREITTPAHGCGLDGFLRHRARRLLGIVNGIDTHAWNPATDPVLPAHYDAEDLSGKAACRAALARELGIDVAPDELLVGLVSRLTHQKGVDLLAALAPELGALGARVIVLGSGEGDLEDQLRAQSARPGTRLTARLGFDLSLARRIYAGCDALAMPSRFEPCGLNQLYAMRYGTVPIVRAVGGLRDTVSDPETGFCFEDADENGLRWALGRAARVFRENPDGWRSMVRAGMARDSSWAPSAAAYVALYREIAATAVD